MASWIQHTINTVGLEPSIGFLHETSGYQTKQSLVYDLQEPFRWLADVAVWEAFESGVLDLPDFYFTGDDYRYRFDPEAKQRFLDLLRERFNRGISYRGRALKWDTVIEQKTNELGRFLLGKSILDFAEPLELWPFLSRMTPLIARKEQICILRRCLGFQAAEVIDDCQVETHKSLRTFVDCLCYCFSRWELQLQKSQGH